MNEEPGQNHQQDLKGGVDLAGPVAKSIDDFKRQALGQKAVGIVLVGVTGQGALMLSMHMPGGELQVLGLLEKAKIVVQQLGQQQKQQQGPQIPRIGG